MPGRIIQVSDDPHTFESVPGPRGWPLVVVVVIEVLLELGAWQREQDSVSTVELVVFGLSAFIVTFAVCYYFRDRADRVVISTEGVREFHRKGESTGWVLRNKTPCSEWAEARVSSYWEDGTLTTPLYLELIHKGCKNDRRIVLSSSPRWALLGLVMDFEYLSELDSAAAEINEILRPTPKATPPSLEQQPTVQTMREGWRHAPLPSARGKLSRANVR